MKLYTKYLPNISGVIYEYIDGIELFDYIIDKSIEKPLIEKMSIIRDLVTTLSYIHKQNITHRDINPNNIMIRMKTKKPVYIDFGLSKHIGFTIYDKGSFEYMNPLRVYNCSNRVLHKTTIYDDWYSLAKTIFNIINHNQPYTFILGNMKQSYYIKKKYLKEINFNLDFFVKQFSKQNIDIKFIREIKNMFCKRIFNDKNKIDYLNNYLS